MGVRSEHRLRLRRVDHRRDLRPLVAWMKVRLVEIPRRQTRHNLVDRASLSVYGALALWSGACVG